MKKELRFDLGPIILFLVNFIIFSKFFHFFPIGINGDFIPSPGTAIFN